MKGSEGKEVTTINEAWDDLTAGLPKDLHDFVRYQLKQAYFSGAWAFHSLEADILESQDNVTERLSALYLELTNAIEELDELDKACEESLEGSRRKH